MYKSLRNYPFLGVILFALVFQSCQQSNTPDSSAADVANAKSILTITFSGSDGAQSVTGNLVLPTSTGGGVTVSWSSTDDAVISSTGVVVRPAIGQPDANITLTATLTKAPSGIDTKKFVLVVKSLVPITYSVSFVTNGGSPIGGISDLVDGSLITKPTDPTKSGSTFSGWYKDQGLLSLWNFAQDTVTSNTTLYAKWTVILIPMVTVSGGTFQRDGTTSNLTTVSNFQMSKYSVTQTQYQTVMGTNPSRFSSDLSRPVERVTWYDAVEFCNKASLLEGKAPVYFITGRTPATGYPITNATVTADFTKSGYRLPTEMQWLWAAMGGASDSKPGDIVGGINTGGYKKAFAGDNGSNSIDSYAWHYNNAGLTTHPVGTKLANELGLYDMSGNVWQWCWDIYGPIASGAQTNPTGATSGGYKIYRGGSWTNTTDFCVLANRYDYDALYWDHHWGFRVALP